MTADDILARWYAAIRAGDASALGQATTDDVVVRWNGPVGTIPWAGLWEGRAKVITFFRRVGEHLEVASVKTLQTVADENGAATVIEGLWRVKATGEEIVARSANLFRFEGDRVAAYEIFPDVPAFVAALGRV